MNAPPLAIDPALLRRYDRPGPRYTSYPPAPHFGSGFGAAALRDAIVESNGDPIPRALSLYVHVPFCASPCFYCGCNRIITRDRRRGPAYAARIVREIAMTGALVDRDRDVVQIHFGGGTPNFLAPTDLAGILDAVKRHFTLSQRPDRDISIEIDPRTVSVDDVAELAALGFDRASLGVQDFDPDVQRAVNRIQSVAETLEVIAACRANGMRSVSVDLIYGLPLQTVTSFSRTLATVIEARPDRIAVYGYAHLPQRFKAQRHIVEGDLPEADAKLALLACAIQMLSSAGYVYIGMDHFALPDDELARAQRHGTLQRNFMGYTTHAQTDLIGVGVSAISHVGSTFSQNPRELPAWEAAIDAGTLPACRGTWLSPDDILRADVIQSLMCHGHVPVTEIERRYGIDFATYFASSLTQLAPLVADGLVRIARDRIDVTDVGRLLLRNVAMCFDRYLATSTVVPLSRAI